MLYKCFKDFKRRHQECVKYFHPTFIFQNETNMTMFHSTITYDVQVFAVTLLSLGSVDSSDAVNARVPLGAILLSGHPKNSLNKTSDITVTNIW